MLEHILYHLLEIDVKTLISVLFWGNLASVALICSYRLTTNHEGDQQLSNYLILSKSLQAVAFFLLFFRGDFPEILSVNLGNTMLFMGFYCEARAMLAIIQENNHRLITISRFMLVLSAVGFNVLDHFFPDSSLRVALASTCVFCILLIPNLKLLLAPRVSHFKRLVGVFYLLFISLLLPRAVYAMFYSIDVHSSFLIQTLTFLSLVLVLIFSLSAYLLLIKENTDRIMSLMATTDSLTGLSNRRSFMAGATRLFERHREEGRPLAFLFLDIDHFKRTNDTYGHAFGDAVLVSLADSIRHSLRGHDLSCRYGGEEFVAILPDSGLTAAEKAARRIMENVAATAFDQHPEFNYTVSIGVTGGVPAPDENLDIYLKKADQALYKAKRQGRNRIERA